MNRTLLDTMIVLRLFDREDARYAEVYPHVAHLIQIGVALFVAPQVLYEARVVLTRPVSDHGKGQDAAVFADLIENLRSYAAIIPDPPDLVGRWLELCDAHNVVGKRCHDVRLVAWMRAHGVDTILTLNPKDFSTFPIHVVAPGTM